ncbi:MAG: DUF2157 domain-containing protein [Flavobacteriales bacterium]
MHDPRLSEALPELLRDGLLTPEQVERIRARYHAGSEQAGNRQLLVFALLGSLLVGLWIILIIAHNWDDLPARCAPCSPLFPCCSAKVWSGTRCVTDQRSPAGAKAVRCCWPAGSAPALRSSAASTTSMAS